MIRGRCYGLITFTIDDNINNVEKNCLLYVHVLNKNNSTHVAKDKLRVIILS